MEISFCSYPSCSQSDRYEISHVLSWHVQNFHVIYDTPQWNYTNTNFPSNLNYDGKIVREMGPNYKKTNG